MRASRTFPTVLKTAPFPALKRGQSERAHRESFQTRSARISTFHNSYGRNSCIHSFPTLTKDRIASFQRCFQRRPVQSLPLRSRCCPRHCAGTTVDDEDNLLPTAWSVGKHGDLLLGFHYVKRISGNLETSGLAADGAGKDPVCQTADEPPWEVCRSGQRDCPPGSDLTGVAFSTLRLPLSLHIKCYQYHSGTSRVTVGTFLMARCTIPWG